MSGGLELLAEALKPDLGDVGLDLGLGLLLLEPALEAAERALELLRVLGVARAHALARLRRLLDLLRVHSLRFFLPFFLPRLLSRVLFDRVYQRANGTVFSVRFP